MKKTPHTSERILAVKDGFSLVETVMALGIMGLAITALLGLLPHGIEMSRKAGNASAQARIVDTISTRLNNMNFGAIAAQNGVRMMFDDQGVQVDQADAAVSGVYVARVVVNGGGAGAKLPGVATPQPLLQAVTVQVAPTPKFNFNFDGANPRTFQSMPLLLGPVIPSIP